MQRSFQFTSPKDSPLCNKFDELRQQPGNEGLTKGLARKTYGFCGDIGRGRTVRSLAMLLANYEDVHLVFIAPQHPKLEMRSDLRERLHDRGVRVTEVDSFDEPVDGRPAIEALDALYMTRIQKEHDEPGDKESFDKIDFSRYCLDRELVARMKEYAPILHPFPRDQHFGEIPPEIDNDHRAMYFRQARNGMWVRAALLAFLCDVDHSIYRFFHSEYQEHHDYNEDLAV